MSFCVNTLLMPSNTTSTFLAILTGTAFTAVLTVLTDLWISWKTKSNVSVSYHLTVKMYVHSSVPFFILTNFPTKNLFMQCFYFSQKLMHHRAKEHVCLYRLCPSVSGWTLHNFQHFGYHSDVHYITFDILEVENWFKLVCISLHADLSAFMKLSNFLPEQLTRTSQCLFVVSLSKNS